MNRHLRTAATIAKAHAQLQGYHHRVAIEQLCNEVDRLRAGADATPRELGEWPTPGQWIADFVNADEGRRLKIAESVLDDAQAALQWALRGGR